MGEMNRRNDEVLRGAQRELENASRTTHGRARQKRIKVSVISPPGCFIFKTRSDAESLRELHDSVGANLGGSLDEFVEWREPIFSASRKRLLPSADSESLGQRDDYRHFRTISYLPSIHPCWTKLDSLPLSSGMYKGLTGTQRDQC